MSDIYEFTITGRIGVDCRYSDIAAHLTAARVAGKDVHIVIDTAGGDLPEAVAIHQLLRSFPLGVTAEIRCAASAGAIIAMGADHRTIARNAWLLIHGVQTVIAGNIHQIRAEADRLERMNQSQVEVFVDAGLTREQAQELVGKESWIDADTAHALGLVDDVTAALDPPPDGPSPHDVDAARRSLLRNAVTERTPEAQESNAQAYAAAVVSVPALAPLEPVATPQTFPELEGRTEVRRRRDQALALEAERLRTTTATYRAGPQTWRCQACGAMNTHSPGEGLTPTPCNRCRATGIN